jgi:hypothetical protein
MARFGNHANELNPFGQELSDGWTAPSDPIDIIDEQSGASTAGVVQPPSDVAHDDATDGISAFSFHAADGQSDSLQVPVVDAQELGGGHSDFGPYGTLGGGATHDIVQPSVQSQPAGVIGVGAGDPFVCPSEAISHDEFAASGFAGPAPGGTSDGGGMVANSVNSDIRSASATFSSVTSPETVTTPGSGFVFINTYNPGVTGDYRNAIVAAEQYLESQFTNAVTVRCTFDLQSLSPGISGENSFGPIHVSYSSLVNALQSHATSADDLAAVAALNSLSDPSHGAGFSVPIGEARALGLAGAGSSTDDTIILNTVYWTPTALQNSQTDATAVVEHELTEGIMGRIGGLWAPMDLFRFTAAGLRDFTGGSDGLNTYFSTDGSNVYTGLQYHAPTASGSPDGFDWADWDQVGDDANARDPFGPGGPGVGDPGTLSATDLRIMDVLGWDRTGGTTDDYANSLTDTTHPFGQVAVNGSSTGTLEVTGDRDWFRVQVTAGRTYLVNLQGQYTGAGTLEDPYLYVHNSSGALVAQIDDIQNGVIRDSRLYFTATTTGTYYLEAGAFADDYTGAYRLSVTAAPPNDYNGNGTSDIMWQNASSGATSEWLMSTAGGIASVPGTPPGPGWSVVAAGDFNNDGTKDLMWQNASTGATNEWLMSTAGGIASVPGTPAGPGWSVVAAGDFNGDGTKDLMWQNASTGATSEWLMSTAGGIASAPATPSGPGWNVVAVGDFNGNGTTDIMWQNASTGATNEWLMSTAGGIASVPGTPAGPGWNVVGINDFGTQTHHDWLFA